MTVGRLRDPREMRKDMVWALGRLRFFPLLEQALVLTGSLAARGSGVPHLVPEVTCHRARTLSLAELPGTVAPGDPCSWGITAAACGRGARVGGHTWDTCAVHVCSAGAHASWSRSPIQLHLEHTDSKTQL